ncbi:MAG: hypothetical protein ACPGXK_16215, partial [Phycisphaerae bacterium]
MERVTSQELRVQRDTGRWHNSWGVGSMWLLALVLAASGTTLSSVSAEPVLVYSNTGPDTFFPPGPGRLIGDDLFLDASCQCNLASFDFLVGGGGSGNGEGYSVEYALYDGCPNNGGTIIPGTEGVAIFDDDADYVIVHEMLENNQALIGSPVWLGAEFSRANAGWYVGAMPEVGFSADVYDFPTFSCEANFGPTLYAGFYARLFCEPQEGAQVDTPDPDNGSALTSQLDDVVLRWNELGANEGGTAIAWEPENLITPENFVDGTVHPDESFAIWEAAIANGEIPDPTTLELPEPAPITFPRQIAGASVPNVTSDDIFWYEDSDDLLANGYTQGQLNFLMSQATNQLLGTHGDNFDFIGFWLNFQPITQFGAAFYQPIENDVSGIGLGQFNQRANFGIVGENVEGWVMMWNQANWGINSSFTHLVLGQEFEHRFALFISPISGNRPMQGNNGSCGRSAHWNFRVDGQGSGMEIAEWVGSNPAIRQGGTLNFNTDIPGSVFSYPDLYLMGYVSGAEMDANASELRYMDGSGCSGSH